MKSGVIYAITSLSGKQYLGSAINFMARKRVHLSQLENGQHHSRYLQRSWNKHGAKNFLFSILIICREEDLFFYEQRALDVFKPAYNVSPSAYGTRGLKWTEEAKIRQLPRRARG